MGTRGGTTGVGGIVSSVGRGLLGAAAGAAGAAMRPAIGACGLVNSLLAGTTAAAAVGGGGAAPGGATRDEPPSAMLPRACVASAAVAARIPAWAGRVRPPRAVCGQDWGGWWPRYDLEQSAVTSALALAENGRFVHEVVVGAWLLLPLARTSMAAGDSCGSAHAADPRAQGSSADGDGDGGGSFGIGRVDARPHAMAYSTVATAARMAVARAHGAAPVCVLTAQRLLVVDAFTAAVSAHAPLQHIRAVALVQHAPAHHPGTGSVARLRIELEHVAAGGTLSALARPLLAPRPAPLGASSSGARGGGVGEADAHGGDGGGGASQVSRGESRRRSSAEPVGVSHAPPFEVVLALDGEALRAVRVQLVYALRAYRARQQLTPPA